MSLQVDLNVIYRIVKRVSFEGVFCQMPLFLSILDTQAKKRFGIRGGLGRGVWSECPAAVSFDCGPVTKGIRIPRFVVSWEVFLPPSG